VKDGVHPVQTPSRIQGEISKAVTMRAYEVYCHVCSPQEALVTGGCRGGFGMCELTAYLYARSFPKDEWRQRVDEAHRDMKGFTEYS